MLSYHKGNALVEFTVLSAIMVPLVLFLPVIGKLSDVNNASVQASRYAAWERTIANSSEKPDIQVSKEVVNRFFGDPELLLETDKALIDLEEDGNSFWMVYESDSEQSQMLKRHSLIGQNASLSKVKTKNESVPVAGAEAISEGLASVGKAMSSLIPDSKWDLEQKGLYTIEVSTDVATNRLLAEGKNCLGVETDAVASCLRHRAAIFVDAWDSSSAAQTEERVRSLVPAGVFQPIGDKLSKFGSVPLFEELKKLDGIFGEVNEDVLPPDRYGDPK